MSRNCSQCGNNGHNSRTCCVEATTNVDIRRSSSSTGLDINNNAVTTTTTTAAAATNGFMLFGVRVTEGSNSTTTTSIRKSVSMNNLSQYQDLQNHDSNIHHHDVVPAGYASDDAVHTSNGIRDRKRGVPWTEAEHRLFLLGLQKVGKGDWRGISRNFVKTRTPTQVASHAQKYFLRRNNLNRRRRRSSLFDIGTTEEENPNLNHHPQQFPSPPHSNSNVNNGLPIPPLQLNLGSNSNGNGLPIPPLQLNHDPQPSDQKIIRPIPLFPLPPSSKMRDLTLNPKKSKVENDDQSTDLSLNLATTATATSSDQQQQEQSSSTSSSSRHSGFQGKSNYSNGGGDVDFNGGNVIRVA